MAVRQTGVDDPDRLVETLHAEYGSLLTRTAWCMLGDQVAVDHAVQDTLIAAWKSWHTRRQGGSPRSWLLGILCNQCRKQQRSWSRWWRRNISAASLMEMPAPEAEGTDCAAELGQLQQALEQLSLDQRSTVVLRYFDGCSVEECAEILGVPAGTVKSRCHKALAKLRGIMDVKGDGV